MIIQWLGQSCFKISTKSNQGECLVATDPFNDDGGLKMPKFQADIITVSQNTDAHNNIEAIRGEPFIIANPGEYETKGVFVYGLANINDQEKIKTTLFKIISEDVTIAHLSGLTQILTDEQLDQLGNIDILLLPIGEKNKLDNKKINEIISQIEPRLVIPMHYRLAGQKSDLEGTESFLKNCGLKSETMEKLKIAKKDLLGEDTRVIILTV